MLLTDDVALVASGEMRLTDPYDCNAYLVTAPDGPVLIDTGCGHDTDRIVDRCTATLGRPVAALLTHAHADHSQGAPTLQDHGISVVASNRTADLVRDGTEFELGLDAAKRDDAYPSEYTFTHFDPDRTFAPGSELDIAGRTFTPVPVRGHADDHVCYLTRANGGPACFAGDVVAADGKISLLNVPGSSLAGYRADIGNLTDRGIEALYPGHGMPKLADGQAAIDRAATALDGMFSPPSRT